MFIVSDFGGESCDEVLAVSDSLRWHPAPCREAGQSSPSNAGGGFTPGSFGGYEEGVGTLRSQGGDLGGGSETLAVWPEVSMPCMSRDYKGPRNYQDGGLQNSVVTGCDVFNGEETGDTAATVTSATGIANASGPKVMSFAPSDLKRGFGQKPEIELSGTLKKEHNDQSPHVVTSQQGGEGVGVATYDARGNGDGLTTCTLTGDHQSRVTDYTSLAASNLTVRRLTPRECMRLQGFDDDHCDERCELELVGNEWKATGKVVKQADGPIYKQAGNAVSVPVAEWIGRRLKRLQATYTPEELEELGVGTTCPQTLGEYLREREDQG